MGHVVVAKERKSSRTQNTVEFFLLPCWMNITHWNILLKLRYCEKATKFEKNSHFFWHLLIIVKRSEVFFNFLWTFQNTYTFIRFGKMTKKGYLVLGVLFGIYWHLKISFGWKVSNLKFVVSKKATKIDEIFPVRLTLTT